MTFELSSAPIVRLAWERGLGLPKDSLVMGADHSRILHDTTPGKSEDSAQPDNTVTFVRLWDQAILVAPAPILEAAAAFSDDELSDHAVMLRLTRDFGGRGHGVQALYYADDLPVQQTAGDVLVSHGNPEAVALESLCPPDDVNEVGLAALPHKYTVLHQEVGQDGEANDADAGPVACSAYDEWQGLLARLGTLVVPEYRRQGLGLLATSIAAHEALASGLILQWRADVNNPSAHALAASLGFSVAGLQTTVSLSAPRR
jgi:GNAT superfamily N-acetyltransferase